MRMDPPAARSESPPLLQLTDHATTKLLAAAAGVGEGGACASARCFRWRRRQNAPDLRRKTNRSSKVRRNLPPKAWNPVATNG